MWNDIRFALRSFRRTPVFSAVAVLTLALGIGATAAIFSLFYQVLLRSLPVRSPEQLVVLHSSGPGLPGGSSSDSYESVFSYPMYKRLQDKSQLFDGWAARSGSTIQVVRQSGSERGKAEVVSGNYFDVLGLRPALGRLLSRQDDSVRGGNPVAVLSFRYWTDHLGSRPSVLNQQILINGHPFVIVGVAPRGFDGFLTGESPAIFLPISMTPQISPSWEDFDRPGLQWLNIVGRLKPGVSRAQATASLRPLWVSMLRNDSDQLGVKDQAARQRLLAKPIELHSASQGINELETQWRKPLTALFAMVGLLLVIACGNLANLLIARAVARTREIAVRVAIGADRWQVIRQSLAESLVLAVAGGIIGTVLSFFLVRSLIALLPEDVAGHWITAKPDVTVLAFSLVLVLTTIVLFGLLPAMQVARVDPMPALKDQSSNASGSSGQTRWRRALVAGQLAVSLCLLVGAALFAKTLVNLLSHDPGFRPDHLMTFSVDPRFSGYSVDTGRSLYREIRQKLTLLPGVESVSIAEFSPLSNSEASSNVTVEGFHPRADEDADSDENAVGPGFFRTLGTALVSGREFDDHDREGSPKVAMVNEAFVRHFIRNRDAAGTRMEVGAGRPLDTAIVGVVKDAQNLSLRETVKPTFYVPFDQSYKQQKQIRQAAFFVRAKSDLPALERSVRALVRSINAALPVYSVRTMTKKVDESIYTERLIAILGTAFSVLAMLLAAIGLYGVMAYSVARRTAEIGIRLALGAMPRQVLQLIMKEVLLLATAGVLIGLPAAYVLARLLESQLYGVRAGNPASFCLSVGILVAAAAIAGIIPAWRATTVDPKDALRYE
jgi:predicted permease